MTKYEILFIFVKFILMLL